MKLTLISIIITLLSSLTFAKPQFFPQDDDDNVKLESVSQSTTTLTFPESPAAKPSAKSISFESDKTIDDILAASREGRKLNFTDGRYDQILGDPTIKEKVASASEVEARGFIHDKLCSIGLCDNNYNGGYGGHHGLGPAVKDVQLVQPVAVKPVGHPIPAIPLENKHHYPGQSYPSYGPPGPSFDSFGPPPPFGKPGPAPGFGGAVGGPLYNPRPGGPQIFPHPSPSYGPLPPPRPFKPNYGGNGLSHPPILPITKPVNTHVHHHIHHNQPELPLLDGYYGAAQKSSVSLASPAGKNLGTYSEAQTLNPSYAKNCVCIPAEQCYIESAGSQPNQIVEGVGIPNNGFVGYGIDPRNLKAGHSGIESNYTDGEYETTTIEYEYEIPDSPKNHSRGRRDVGGIEGGILTPTTISEIEPRQLNYNGQNGPRSCQPGFVCCNSRNPQQQQHPLPSATNNNFVDYNNGRQQQYPSQQHQYGQCGKKQTEGISGRVISGGNPASSLSIDGETSFGDYPWHVAILKNDGFVCSGSLIDSFNIITAAHCIKRLTAPELKVRLGEWDVNHETEFYPFVESQVESIRIHPDFYAGNLVNDVAILRLASGIDFPRQPHISPICLPPPHLDFTGRRCFVSGWGKDAFGSHGKFQNVLKEVDLPVLSHFDCEQKLKRTKLGYDFLLDKGFVCAGGEAAKDACKGDGGGGLVCDVQGTWYLAGVVSWGVGCGQVEVPGIYAKVSQYTPWIQQNTGIQH